MKQGYEWDCPNCGERVTSWTMPPLLGISQSALAAALDELGTDYGSSWESEQLPRAFLTDGKYADGRALAAAIFAKLEGQG